MARGRWFRKYENAMDNPKVQMLSDWHYRAWDTLLCLASKHGGEFTDDLSVLSFVLRKPAGKVRDTMQVLLSANLFEKTEAGYKPHDWDDHQYKSDVSTGRVQQFRNRKRNADETFHNADETVSETPPETETETESPSLRSGERAPRKQKMPEDWPSEEDRSKAICYWEKVGRSDLIPRLDVEIEKATANHRGRGTRSVDWSAVWTTWYVRAIEYNRPPPKSAISEIKSPVLKVV